MAACGVWAAWGRFRVIAVCAAVLGMGMATSAKAAPSARQIRVLTYNVQNLFDTENDPDTSDDEFTPTGRQQWTERVLRDKITNIGRVILESKADVVGLVEVENEAVVRRLVREGLRNQFPYIAIGESADPRGIRNAVISKYPILTVKNHDLNRGPLVGHGTRHILDAQIRLPNGSRMTVFVNHWPARNRGPDREAQRLESARILTEKVTAAIRMDARLLALAVGDFNDELKDVPFQRGMKLVDSFKDLFASGPGSFVALDGQLMNLPPEQRGTHYFHPGKSWSTLDHILLAAGHEAARDVNRAGVRYVEGSTQIYRHFFVDSRTGIAEGCEVVSREKTPNLGACPRGTSDHLPMFADFEFTR